jgi:hypothetical protein
VPQIGIAPQDESFKEAVALQRRLADCNRILTHAKQFADYRWGSISFKNTEIDDGHVHVVNSSTAVAVIEKCPDLFKPKDLKAYNGMNLEAICNFYGERYVPRQDSDDLDVDPPYDTAQPGKGYWKSQDLDKWSPYVTALVLGAIGRAIQQSDRRTTEAILGKSKLGTILRAEAKELVEWLSEWSVTDKDNYDHVFFAATVLETLELLEEVRGNFDLGDECRKLLRGCERQALSRLQKEFYQHLSFSLGDMPGHLDVASLILSMFCLAQFGSGLTEIREDVLEKGLTEAFRHQQPTTGQWDTATPLLGTETGRVGCSSVELMNHILRIDRPAMRFSQFRDYFDRLFDLFFRARERSNPAKGWAVDIRRSESQRQTWYGCLVFEFIHLYAEGIKQHLGRQVIRDFRVKPDPPKLKWSQIGDYHEYKQRIDEHIIWPRKGKSPLENAKTSLILFGPPGTAKTSVGHAIAAELGWRFIEIGPGDFLTNGLEGLFGLGDFIFERLLMIENVVVLFDEIDELVTVRDAGADKLSRFLTTYMLPWIQRLRDRGKIIFIFSTNHIERFDPAIKRTDRIDLVLPVGPPQGDERRRVFSSAFEGKLDEAAIKAIVEKVPARATFGEIQAAIDDIIVRGGQVTPKSLLTRLGSKKLLLSKKKWKEFTRASKPFLGGGRSE